MCGCEVHSQINARCTCICPEHDNALKDWNVLRAWIGELQEGLRRVPFVPVDESEEDAW